MLNIKNFILSFIVFTIVMLLIFAIIDYVSPILFASLLNPSSLGTIVLESIFALISFYPALIVYSSNKVNNLRFLVSAIVYIILIRLWNFLYVLVYGTPRPTNSGFSLIVEVILSLIFFYIAIWLGGHKLDNKKNKSKPSPNKK